MNKLAVSKIDWIIKTMQRVAKRENAPVYRINKITKRDPFRSLVFTILSSRTRDDNTIKACAKLFKIADNPGLLAKMQIKKIESAI
jgi:exodeoxyribonuclease-3/endonuclease-3